MTSKHTHNATSFLASRDGVTHCDSPDGVMTDPSGPDPVLASHSLAQGSLPGLQTSAIYGRRGSGSSVSADLGRSLANRLRPRMLLLGSTLFALTWRVRVTPSGRRIYALRARAHLTSGNDCTSWQSPNAGDAKGRTYQYDNHDKTRPRPSNEGLLVGWTTAAARDWRDGRSNQHGKNKRPLDEVAMLASWPTPRTPTGGAESGEWKKELGRTESGGGDLQAAALLASWPTPMSGSPKTDEYNEAGDTCNGRKTRLLVSGLTASGSNASTGKRGQLNPAFSRWLQGFPEEWLWCVPSNKPDPRYKKHIGIVQREHSEDSATRSCRRSRRSS